MTRLVSVGFAVFSGLSSLPSQAFVAPDGNNYHAGVIQVSAGATHTCALMADFHVSCWGSGGAALGLTPLPVPGIDTAIKVVSGNNFACALLLDHTVSCWGDNSSGQLGDGTYTARPSQPMPVRWGRNPLGDIADIAAGDSHACAVKGDDASRTVWCWGANSARQLGNYTYTHDAVPVPIEVIIHDTAAGDPPLSGVETVSAGNAHTCALFAGSHTLACWGGNHFRQVGNIGATSETVDSPVGVKVYDDKSVLVDFVSAGDLSVGGFHTCVLSIAGPEDANFAAACWGDDDSGQLGNPIGSTPVPAAVVRPYNSPFTKYYDVTAFSKVALGSEVSCAIDHDENYPPVTLASTFVLCWGDNSYGQVGNSTDCAASCETPVRVVNGADWGDSLDISAGAQHVCVRTQTNGRLFCWGRNDSGQLGTGSVSSGPHDEPVAAKVDPPIFTDNLDGN